MEKEKEIDDIIRDTRKINFKCIAYRMCQSNATQSR